MMKTPSKAELGSRKLERVTLKNDCRAPQPHTGYGIRCAETIRPRRDLSRNIPSNASWRRARAELPAEFFSLALCDLQRTYTIGVIAEEIGDAYGSMIISGNRAAPAAE